MKFLILTIIKIYQYIASPWLGNNCKFYPSCSQYAIDAITSYGLIKGVYISIIRILKCSPFSNGGYDPIKKKDIM
ncbi:membrane protein insertion efficiency factor YidD [Rickettsia endosymbiont of Cardiosporidium cionae]|uniref:membrane protein insertion efficiency factor YidD n=1 Tax=Rickettsia endosymbiont of Cardiosporidium cionae TaxID=2777155 RepID=UPI001893D22A|nr:membrane protein insertion efficiency factor YidD [Rickettsia endosymbiont of Cardiosporidium cionae]KAF8818504.1 membrane protein insertion efficiency factor YidD [Rickettsia endosymbiont of Cardiosporidium cionae]